MTHGERPEDRALEVARTELAIDVPPGHAARVARAALTATPPPWWELALPVAWRAAVAVNLVAVALLAWVLLRERPAGEPADASPAMPVDVDGMLTAEETGMLSRALGLDAEVSP